VTITDLPITPAERDALWYKLHSGAHKLYEVGHTLAQASFARTRSGRGTCSDPADDAIWAERNYYLDARAELLELAG
jgi:hypothetical protein